ncbi:MAG TPA: dihydrofolate reductase family protein [Micromonosporaceae bacterium]|jgi:dihydrofolate reductase
MRKLIVSTIMSLDGYVAGPGGNPMVLPMDASFDEFNLDELKAADVVLLGGTSYGMFSGFWPGVAGDASFSATNREFSRLYNAVDKVVISDRATPPPAGHPWANNTRIVKRAKAREEVVKLKEGDGKGIVTFASGTLWNDLLAQGLVDELHLMIGALFLRDGTPAVGAGAPPLRRIDVRTFDNSDNVLARYAVQNNA